MAELSLVDVSVAYGEVLALNRLNLEVEVGESLAVVGPSGAGKSTLLKVICGLVPPTGGSVAVRGIGLDTLNETGRSKIRAQRFGFVFQDYNLVDYLTAAQNVAITHHLRKGDDSVQDVLAAVGLSERASHLPRQLSGGEQQRVSVARALLNSPTIIVADEPTGALDQANQDIILDILLDQSSRGAAVICVTHSEQVSSRFGRILRLEEGVVLGS